MKESDRDYFARRGREERERSRIAASPRLQSIHRQLADLCEEQSNRSANENSRSPFTRSGPGLVE